MAKKFEIIEDADVISRIKDEGFSEVVTTYIGAAWGSKDKKFAVQWPVPETEEQAQERYNCSLADLIADGVRKLSTSPSYENVALATDSEGNFLEDKPFADKSDETILAEMQTLADAFKVGQRKPGKAHRSRCDEVPTRGSAGTAAC